MAEQILKPVEIDRMLFAFPAQVLDKMPAMEEIPEEFKRTTLVTMQWRDVQSYWFMGLWRDIEMLPAEGIDAEMAHRHLDAIQRSYQPRHEHKVAAVAYLASLWFSAIRYRTDADDETWRYAGDQDIWDELDEVREEVRDD